MNPSGRKVCDVPGSGPAVVGTLTPVGSLRLAAGLVATQLLHHCWAEPQGSGPGVRGSASASQGALSWQAAQPALASLPVRMPWWCQPVGCADVGGRVRASYACLRRSLVINRKRAPGRVRTRWPSDVCGLSVARGHLWLLCFLSNHAFVNVRSSL